MRSKSLMQAAAAAAVATVVGRGAGTAAMAAPKAPSEAARPAIIVLAGAE